MLKFEFAIEAIIISIKKIKKGIKCELMPFELNWTLLSIEREFCLLHLYLSMTSICSLPCWMFAIVKNLDRLLDQCFFDHLQGCFWPVLIGSKLSLQVVVVAFKAVAWSTIRFPQLLESKTKTALWAAEASHCWQSQTIVGPLSSSGSLNETTTLCFMVAADTCHLSAL